VSGRHNGPSSWRKTAFRAALDLAERRIELDPDAECTPEELIAFMKANPELSQLVVGNPELDDDCPICRAIREEYGEPERMPMSDGSTIDMYGPAQRRRAN
jgi:hypothetical protein